MTSAIGMLSERYLSDLLNGFSTDGDIPNLLLKNISSDSRKLQAGDVFLAIKGVTRHGIDFSLNAHRVKAGIVLYDSNDDYAEERLGLLSKQMTIPVLGVDGLNEHYGEFISRFYAEPSNNMTLIGITGTDGKTSITHLLSQALSRLGHKVGSIGTLGVGLANELVDSGLTTPNADLIQKSLADFNAQNCDTVVMEVSSHALQQYRVVGCRFDIALLSNLGSDHLDYHQNLSHYAAAKERLFHWDCLSTRVLNKDDALGQALALKFKKSSVLTYSAGVLKHKNSAADVRLEALYSVQGSKILSIQTPDALLSIATQLLGDFNIENILAVVSVLVALGKSPTEITQACTKLQPIVGRMEQINVTGLKQVIVDFAHTAQALKASLKAAKEQCKGQLWCVFGCGGGRDKSKRATMGIVAELFSDKIVITDDNPRHEDAHKIVDDILLGCKKVHQHRVIHDRKMAIKYAIEQSKEGDTVLIAGKGHESFQIIRDQKIPFSDQYVATQYLRGKL